MNPLNAEFSLAPHRRESQMFEDRIQHITVGLKMERATQQRMQVACSSRVQPLLTVGIETGVSALQPQKTELCQGEQGWPPQNPREVCPANTLTSALSCAGQRT
jgi:hypothetical protein